MMTNTQEKNEFLYSEVNTNINIENARKAISQNMLADGMDFLLDLQKSKGSVLVDAKTGDEYLDFFTFYASAPIGMNHLKLNNPEFREKIASAALNKPANSDVYTLEMAEFVDAFSRIAKPDYMKYLFFIEGGALAVENAIKAAFDWKVQKNFAKGYKDEVGHQIIHFREAFHGRSGYTMSMTNTEPNKVRYYPKFSWPRIINPKVIFPQEKHLNEIIESEEQAINEIYSALKERKDDIAALIIEPIQSEGGDNFFRKEFHKKLREITLENDILLIYDEVQTGMGMTGKFWAADHYEHPDIIAFGKKTQVCGIMSTDRIDEVETNVFRKSSRINSTWGGNLTDMVRSKRFLEVITEDSLVKNAESMGAYLLNELKKLEQEFPELVTQARGLGLICSFDLPSTIIRDEFRKNCYKEKLIILGCGQRSIRFRTPLNVIKDELDKGLQIIKNVLFLLSSNN